MYARELVFAVLMLSALVSCSTESSPAVQSEIGLARSDSRRAQSVFPTPLPTFVAGPTPRPVSSNTPGPKPIPTLPATHHVLYVSCYQHDLYAFNSGSTVPAVTNYNGIANPIGLAVDQLGKLYVANNGLNNAPGNVTEYPVGTTSPSVTLTNGISHPIGIAVDTSGITYVSNYGVPGSIPSNLAEFPAGSLSPSVVLKNGVGPDPYGVAVSVDAAGTLYVANRFGANTVSEFSPGSSSPSVTLTKGISAPAELAVDSFGTLYVANSGNSTITEYPQGSTSPSVTISSGLNHPSGVTVDASGTVYVANSGDNTVMEYLAGSTSPVIAIPSSSFSHCGGVPYFVAVSPSAIFAPSALFETLRARALHKMPYNR